MPLAEELDAKMDFGGVLPKALLVSLRDPNDPMAEQERRCFTVRSGLGPEGVERYPMQEGTPDVYLLRRYDAIFYGGSGAYSVLDPMPWIQATIDTLLRTLDLGLPAYASCFGFHGLARALGGEVIHDESQAEMGATCLALTDAGRVDPLYSALPNRFWAQEGHHDRVSRLPSGVTLLATGDLCWEQAFRVDGAPFWASQFHPELTPAWTAERFRYYQDHYMDPKEAEGLLRGIEAGHNTPELEELLPRLIRREY